MWYLLQVTQKQRSVVKHINELEVTTDRITAMAEHLKNVRQELQHTQVGYVNLFIDDGVVYVCLFSV